MMDIVIHAGYYKTATTTIQSTLQSNRARLAELGILYPQTGLRRNMGIPEPSSMGHHLLFHAIRRVVEAADKGAALAAMQETLQKEIAAAHPTTVVLSTELLAGTPRKHKQLFLDYFSPWPGQVRVVYAVSLPHWLAESMAKQVMKFGRVPEPMAIGNVLANRMLKDLTHWNELLGVQTVQPVYFSKMHFDTFLGSLYAALAVPRRELMASSGLALNTAVSKDGLLLRREIYRALTAQGLTIDRKFRDVLEVEISSWESSLPAQNKRPMTILSGEQQYEILQSATRLRALLEAQMVSDDRALMVDDWDAELARLADPHRGEIPCERNGDGVNAADAVDLCFRLMKLSRIREALKPSRTRVRRKPTGN